MQHVQATFQLYTCPDFPARQFFIWLVQLVTNERQFSGNKFNCLWISFQISNASFCANRDVTWAIHSLLRLSQILLMVCRSCGRKNKIMTFCKKTPRCVRWHSIIYRNVDVKGFSRYEVGGWCCKTKRLKKNLNEEWNSDNWWGRQNKILHRNESLSHGVPLEAKYPEYFVKMTSENPTYLAKNDFEEINVSEFLTSPELEVMNLSRCGTLLLPTATSKNHETRNK